MGSWSRGRDAQTPFLGYAPAKYQTKQWPSKALIEDWYSPSRVSPCFTLSDLLIRDLDNSSQGGRLEVGLRTRLPQSAAAEDANDPPNAKEGKVGYRGTCMLALGFHRGTHTSAW